MGSGFLSDRAVFWPAKCSSDVEVSKGRKGRWKGFLGKSTGGSRGRVGICFLGFCS